MLKTLENRSCFVIPKGKVKEFLGNFAANNH